jgi:hypothetical protein
MMLLKAKRERRGAPVQQTVAGLQQCLETFFVRRASRNLQLLTASLSNATWKEAARVDNVAPLADLYGLE